jgi:hypothetical protein
MRRSLAFTLVPILALAGALAWAQMSIASVTSRGDPALYSRAVAWENALSDRGADSPLSFIHPEVRGNPALRAWLGKAAREFSDAAAAQILEAKVVDAASGVSTYMLQTTGITRRLATIQFQWVKARDGAWYVVPKSL